MSLRTPLLETSLLAALLVPCSIAALAALAGGCSANDAASSVPVTPPPALDRDVEDAAPPPDAPASRAPKPYQGSPLCNASHWMGCYPDDLKAASAQECNLAPNGGQYSPSAGYDKAQLACHVERARGMDLGVQPACTPAGSGTDGMSCSTSTDCAPTYECIADGTCRHYCCAGQCDNAREFCDIQRAAGSMLAVPVCVPIQRCTLLDPQGGSGSCSSTEETCSVVRDNGATSCVAVGPKQEGDSCDSEHCGRDLACIGNADVRTCYRLCRTGTRGSGCEPHQVCTGGLPLFPIPGVGTCQ